MFAPLAVDSFGGWHEAALELLTKLGRQLAGRGRDGAAPAPEAGRGAGEGQHGDAHEQGPGPPASGDRW